MDDQPCRAQHSIGGETRLLLLMLRAVGESRLAKRRTPEPGELGDGTRVEWKHFFIGRE